jgi:hypothetical protein
LSELLRDPRYLLPLAMLLAVILISAAMGAGPDAVTSAVPEIPYVPRADTPTPEPTSEHLRDYQRAADLGALREAALAVHRRTGAFPDSRNAIVPVCETVGDVGCALREARGLPSGDGTRPYYYASDGESYAVFIARTDERADDSRCPMVLPVELRDKPLMCVFVEPES